MLKISQICYLSLGALLFSACAQKHNDIPRTGIYPVCKSPIVAYEFGFLKHGDNDDLQLPYEKIKKDIQDSLKKSGCFTELSENTNAYKIYRLDAIYGSIKQTQNDGKFWKNDTSDTLIFEVQLSFNRIDEARIFYGKSSVQNKNRQYMNFIGDDAILDNNAIHTTLQNAINSATNEAARNFSQLKR